MRAPRRLCGLAALAALAPAVLAEEYLVDKAHVTIKSWDGTSLSADAHVPQQKVTGELFPVVIFANSWASPEFEYLIEAVKLAEQGFLVVEYETRGWPPSGGEVTGAGPDEQRDVSSVIDYILATKAWQPDPAKIALAGISYGAGLALLGAARDARVTAAVSLSGWADIRQALFHNDSPNLVWGGLLLISGKFVGHLDPLIPALWQQLLIGNSTAFDGWCLQRSVKSFASAFKDRPIPILFSNNMEDRLFEGEDMLDFFESYPGPKKMLLNQGIHASAEIGGLIDVPGNYVWRQVIAWLNRWLRGAPAPAKDALVDFQLRSDRSLREQFFHWPSQRLATLTFSMGPRGWHGHGSLLAPSARTATDATANETISFGKDTGFFAGLPIVGEVLQVFVDARIQTSLALSSRSHAIWYYSKLARETRICGTPELSVDLTPSGGKFQVVAYLWSVDWLGVGTLISHGTEACWNCTAGERTTLKFQLRTLCEDVKGGLGLGLDMYSELYQPASTDRDLKLTFHYSQRFSLSVPEVLAGDAPTRSTITV